MQSDLGYSFARHRSRVQIPAVLKICSLVWMWGLCLRNDFHIGLCVELLALFSKESFIRNMLIQLTNNPIFINSMGLIIRTLPWTLVIYLFSLSHLWDSQVCSVLSFYTGTPDWGSWWGSPVAPTYSQPPQILSIWPCRETSLGPVHCDLRSSLLHILSGGRGSADQYIHYSVCKLKI